MEKPYDWTKVEELQLAEVGAEVAVEQKPRIEIPWDQIDNWIESINLDDGRSKGKDKELVLDPGDRRN